MKSELNESIECQQLSHHLVSHQSVQTYLQSLSGQQKHLNVIDIDHTYAKPWNRHPDSQIRAKAAKFLFMKNFPKHFLKKPSINESLNIIDIQTIETKPTLSLLNSNSGEQSIKTTLNDNDINTNELPTPPKNGWTTQMNKLWTKAMKILHSDRLARLSYESLTNETILKRNLIERSANKFRHLFASAGWDLNLLSWLNNTLNEFVGHSFITAYHDSMAILRVKIPSLIDKFYVPPKCETPSRLKQISFDPIQTMLNSYKPKRINGSPLFLIVPNGPQIPHQMTSQRMKHWHNLFGSLGKVITISVISRPYELASDFLNEIRYAVKEKIKECKSTFNEGRPLVLVGFGHSSLVAAHCALDNANNVNATICLGFPLTAINGFRGDLDDPLLETTVATLFVIGQNSTMATLDDMEDFRERITKTETGLIVVGGANDRLIISSSKKKFEGITQAMVDRCIADEIYEFVSGVLNPSSSIHDSIGINSNASTLKNSPNKNSSFVISTPKQRRKRTPKDRERVRDRTKGRPRKKPKVEDQDFKPIVDNTIASNQTTATQSTSISTPTTSHSKLTLTLSLKGSDSLSNPDKNDIPMPSTQPISHSTPDKVTKTKSEDISHNEVSTPSVAPPDSITSTPTPTPTPTPVQTPKTERHYGLSYGISELPTVISQSATRTGRQIRAPKALDV